ncbi:MAG: transporter substrate-binding domain-containing protein [Prevotella sp.]|jgi:signal transduction histidine kinase|nr:transporter substrate-binding domain-containing protein [Prevotella sp.]MBQ5494787.1 transporter substrate-binding domain-containing protein [Prevotella sp.]
MKHRAVCPQILPVVLVLLTCLFSSCSREWKKLFHPQQTVTVSPLAKKLGYSKDRPLVMGMNTSYAPLQYVDDHGRPSGYDVEFTQLLMQRMGIPFTFSPNHWDKMSPGIISGKYDMGLLVYSSYRKDLTNYSNAVFRLYYQIVYRNKDYAAFDFRHLKDKKIAYMKSRPVGLMLKDAGAADCAITDLDSAIVDLAAGKYDGVICYRFQASYYIGLNHLEDKLQADELSLQPREYCYASYNKQLIDAINVELRKMEAEGIIDKVYGQEVVSQFDTFRIPVWVWLLLVAIVFVFLIVFSINRYLLSRRLLVANAKAEESTRMKTNFIKQISHEIRTPLNIVSGFTQVLTSPTTQLSEKEKEEISQQMIEGTERITGLVNKMLELSDMSSQTVLEKKNEVSAQDIARQAVQASGIEQAPHVAFSLQLGQGTDTRFKTHRRSAVRILELLLDNAMKFTHQAESYHAMLEEGKRERVTLTVSYEDSHARFVVEDTGIGIPAKEAERIFDEFVQLDDYYDGTGIGLTVARSLARRLGGDVLLDTSYTDGARFVMTL